jgi:hypothetical protein
MGVAVAVPDARRVERYRVSAGSGEDMISTRPLVVALAWLVLADARAACAQTFPVVPGTTEIQVGVTAISIREDEGGLWSLNPQLRIGFFLQPGFEFQAEGNFRAWPGGAVGGKSYGGGGNLLWYPNLAPTSRNMYLLAGAGGSYFDPPGLKESEFDVALRGGLGYKAPIHLPFLGSAHLTAEYRGEYLLTDPTDFVSGAALGFSFFR